MEWKIWNETNHLIYDLISRYENNLEALPETIRKTHDLKKASMGIIYSGIRRYYPKYQQKGLFNLITLM